VPNNSLFLWNELNETTDEKFAYIENELAHYKNIFNSNKMHSLLEIVNEIETELKLLKGYYYLIKKELDVRINGSVEFYSELNDSYLYNLYLFCRSLLNEIMERLKYIIYSIFDSDVRRRLDQHEIYKNHQISRNLCNYIVKEKIKNSRSINIEAHYGYELNYYWKELTSSKNGIINAPRNNAFYIRFLPIFGHEVSHPIIEINSKKILDDPILHSSYIVTQDFITKIFSFLYTDIDINKIQLITNSVHSEILADLFSTIIFGESFLYAFAGSDLVPQDIINAHLWFVSTAWQTHPPNSLRFKLINQTLKELKNPESSLLNSSWKKIAKLEEDFDRDEPSTNLNLFINDYLKEIQLKDIINTLLDPNSPIKLTQYEPTIKDDVDNLQITDDPISIIRSIWKIRYLRWTSGLNLTRRDTAKYLRILHYSLEARRV